MNKSNLRKTTAWKAALVLLALTVLLGCTRTATMVAEQPFPGVKSDFHGYDMYTFEHNDQKCIVVTPEKVAKGKPWIWRARFWGHKPQAEITLLENGFHVAFVNVAHLFGSPKAVKRWDVFYKYLTEKHGFSKRPALEGMSRGGLIIYNWAAANPDKVSSIYADAAVTDFKSWPGGKGIGDGQLNRWEGCLEAYGLTEEEGLAYKKNPIDQLKPLAKAGIPLLHVCGEIDMIVPISENTAIVEERYKALGGEITVIVKKSVGHAHGLDDPTPVVEFVLKNTKE